MKTIAVIPAFNEQAHISDVVRRTLRYVSAVIVVDDYSKDDTSEMARLAGAAVLRHSLNLGKAAAMKTGCDAAYKAGFNVIVLMDGDGQHDPDHIPDFIKCFEDEDVDIVFGFRKDIRGMPLIRRIGTRFLELTMRRLFHVRIHDMQCGFRAFRSRVYPDLRWTSQRYYADAEIAARTGKCRLRYQEVAIRTIYHDVGKGMTIFDGLYFPYKLLLWKFTLKF